MSILHIYSCLVPWSLMIFFMFFFDWFALGANSLSYIFIILFWFLLINFLLELLSFNLPIVFISISKFLCACLLRMDFDQFFMTYMVWGFKAINLWIFGLCFIWKLLLRFLFLATILHLIRRSVLGAFNIFNL